MARRRGERMIWRPVIVGNPDCRRVALVRAAAERLRWPAPVLVLYADLLEGRTCLADHLTDDAVVRFEPAADRWDTFKLLLKHGIVAALAERYPVLDEAAIHRLQYERGWLIGPRQAYLGFVRLLQSLGRDALAHRAAMMHSVDDIALFFDKPRCQDHLAGRFIPIPASFGAARDYAEVRDLLRAEPRLMVKLAHGSGAAGCMALHRCQGRVRAFTTVAEAAVHGESRLYHSKKVRHLHDEAVIAALVDRLCREKVQVEQWLPKARLAGHNFDLRIVVIGGAPRHALVRVGRSTFTNLTLGNRRGDLAAVIARLGPAWEELKDTCANASALFPGSFAVGIDVLVRPDWRRHAVLEVNAFGDLLLNHLDQGQDTYTAELAAWQNTQSPRPHAVTGDVAVMS